MHIAIDLRSLSSGRRTGVENYIAGLLEHLLARDTKNRYTLFYNSWKGDGEPEFHFINALVHRSRVPNRLLNLGFKTGLVTFEKLIGKIDCLFLPNLNPFAKLPATKLAVTVHDLSPLVTPEFYDFKRRAWHRFIGIQQTLKAADVIFAVSEHTKQDVLRLAGVPEHRVRVAYPGTDHAVYRRDISDAKLREVRNLYNLPGNFLLFLNTIEPRKNVGGFLQAYEQLNLPVDVVIVGGKGWKYQSIFRRIRQSHKRSHIHYIGYVESDEDKAAMIKLARALVYPSFYEGFGFQPLEAMGVGTPVVASSVTSLPEVVGSAGLLVNPYNADEVAAAMREVLVDAQLRQRLAEKGFDQVTKFHWEQTAEHVLSGLNEL